MLSTYPLDFEPLDTSPLPPFIRFAGPTWTSVLRPEVWTAAVQNKTFTSEQRVNTWTAVTQ